MGAIAAIGFELNTVTAGVEITSSVTGTSSSVSTSSTHAHSGTYSFEATSSSSGAGYAEAYILLPSTTIGYARAYIYVTSLPSSNCTILELANGSTPIGAAYMTSAGKIGVGYNVSGTYTYDSTLSAAISLNTWYYIDLKCDTTTDTSIPVTVLLNGTTIDTKTSTPSTGIHITQLDWGIACESVESCSGTIYFDDIRLNDGTGSFQNTYVGAGNLVRVSPNGAGDSNTFLVQVGGTAGSANNYTRVNEVTPDNATSYNASAVVGASDLFRVGSSGITGNPIINAVFIGGVFANITGASATTAIEFQAEQQSGGTIVKSSAIVPDSTTWITNGVAYNAVYPLILYQDPTSTNWNLTTLGTMQIGYTISATLTDAVGCTNIWAYIDYTPGVAATAHGSTLMSMGIG